MPNRFYGRGRQIHTVPPQAMPAQTQGAVPAVNAAQTTEEAPPVQAKAMGAFPTTSEPEVRRWPHPINGQIRQPETTLYHHIYYTLSRQNQLLADIKALLERLSEKQGTV